MTADAASPGDDAGFRERAAALVAEMTLAEKVRLCCGAGLWHTWGVERLGLPSIMLTDGPHGLRKATGKGAVGLDATEPATCFPTAAALASAWDVALLHEVGVAIGAECRAQGVQVLLGPGLNIKRHPLCGRNFEYFSEDPLLAGELAAALVAGVQSQGVGACLKHYAVNNQETRRMVVDAVVDERTLREIYLRGFEIAVRKARPWTVMCAYNKVNGVYCSEHETLLKGILRDEWGFDGLTMTDWGAANDRVRGLASGLDLEMPGSGGVNDRHLVAAVGAGELDEALLDSAAERVVALTLRTTAGLPGAAAADYAAHHALARRAAAQSAVLLKNDGGLLPLAGQGSLAVVGVFARQPRYQGTGSSRVRPTEIECAFDAIVKLMDPAATLAYAAGYDPAASEPDAALIAEAEAVAAGVDKVALFVGLPEAYESEGFDREHMRLPAQHEHLIEAVCAANANVAVVLLNGAPVAMPWRDRPSAILEAYLGGQGGGGAVAELLFGHSNPSGKLAETLPLAQADVPADPWFPGVGRQVPYREGIYVGYRYFDAAGAEVAFPFGHGLSYTCFEYSDLRVAPVADEPCGFEASVMVRNAGERAGAETAQLYVHHRAAHPHRPEQELAAFAKAQLDVGEAQRLTFTLDGRAFAWFDADAGAWTTSGGVVELRVGASSRDIRLTAEISLPGEATTVRHPHPLRDGQFAAGSFDAWLGRPPPAPEPARPFHLNSTMAELRATWLGRLLRAAFAASFAKRMRLDQLEPAPRKMFMAMLADMPLRSLVLQSGGALGFRTANALAALADGRPVAALRALWGKGGVTRQGGKR